MSEETEQFLEAFCAMVKREGIPELIVYSEKGALKIFENGKQVPCVKNFSLEQHIDHPKATLKIERLLIR